MKAEQLIISIFSVGIFISAVWSFSYSLKEKGNKEFSDIQIESMVDNCISSSKYLSKVDSFKAQDICRCVIEHVVETYSYDQVLELEKLDQDSFTILHTPILTDCLFPVMYEDKHAIISDKSQLHWSSDIDGFWNPSNDDYRLAELILDSAIIENSNEYWLRLSTNSTKNYYRQYSFYTNSTGDSIVYINAFCDIFTIPVDSSGIWIHKPVDWKNKFQIVNDGGDCYWNIKINLTRKTYSEFMVNGEA